MATQIEINLPKSDKQAALDGAFNKIADKILDAANIAVENGLDGTGVYLNLLQKQLRETKFFAFKNLEGFQNGND